MASDWRWNWYGSERTTNGAHAGNQVRPPAEEDGEEPDRVEDQQEEPESVWHEQRTMMSSEAEQLVAELQALLAAGRKIEAIKRYREATGVGLKEAKETVEAIQRNEPLPERKPVDSALENEVVSLLEGGRYIQAIKLYRERTGVGLKDAKDAVKALAAQRGIVAPARSGCLGVVLLLMVISVTAIAFGGQRANRPVPAVTLADALAVIKSKQLVDLTHTFAPGIPHWPGFPDEKRVALYPGWSKEALKYLYEGRKITASGHETTDTDPGIATSKGDYSLETYILGTNHYQIELLANLDKVPEAGAIVVVSFPKPKGGSGFPARVFAILP
jgi:ribosomal protein L7/L12